MPAAKSKKRKVAEALPRHVVEEKLGVSSGAGQNLTAWHLGKIRRAARMLENGLSPEQIGRELRLSADQVRELAYDNENEPKPAAESFSDWRKRMNEEMERKSVTFSAKVLDYAVTVEGPALLGVTGAAKDASAIGYLWLRKGDDTAKSRITVDFTVLANAQPALQGGTEALEVESETAP